MNFLDWIIIAVLCFFLLKSIIRGATREIFSLLAIVLAGILSVQYYLIPARFFQPYLQPYISAEWAYNITGFIVIFLTVYVLVNVAGWVLSKLIEKVHLSVIDKFAGAFVGAAKAYIVVCCIIILLTLSPRGNKLLNDSTLSSYGLLFVKYISEVLPDPLKGIINKRTSAIKK